MSGLRVAVTRAPSQSEPLARALAEAGAVPVMVPLIRIGPPADPSPLRDAAANATAWDRVVFTSRNGVHAFLDAIAGHGHATDVIRAVAAVGPATAGALEACGLSADIVPATPNAEALARALHEADALEGHRILWPHGASARLSFAHALESRGALLHRVEAYRTDPDPAGARALRRRINAEAIDVITFASPSAVRCWVEECGTTTGNARIAVIGPVTARAATEAGMQIHVQATQQTMEGMVAAILDARAR